MSAPCIVYLDTQDYSRFGDVLRGVNKGDREASLYQELLDLKQSGAAIFPCSGPLISELLQYDPVHRKTTICKAQAVEALADGNAFIGPPRLMTLEVAQAAYSLGFLDDEPTGRALSGDWYWHPNIGNALADLKGQVGQVLNESISQTPLNRAARRGLKAQTRTTSKAADFAAQAVPELARKWGVSEESVKRSIIAAMKGRVTTEQASKMMFAEITRPTAYVSVMFENYEGPNDFHRWIKDFGTRMQAMAQSFRDAVANLPDHLRATLAKSLQRDLPDTFQDVGGKMIKWLDRDDFEFGLTNEIADRFAADNELARRIPSCAMMSNIITAYVVENASDKPTGKAPDDGADFIHALYAPHCDLWRGDQRFSHFLRKAVPGLAQKIVADRFDLPKRIKAFAALSR